jgi:hypothetical protein
MKNSYWAWEWGIGNGALGIGHWASGIEHWASGIEEILLILPQIKDYGLGFPPV